MAVNSRTTLRGLMNRDLNIRGNRKKVANFTYSTYQYIRDLIDSVVFADELDYAGISVLDNAVPTVLNGAAHTQVTDFDTNNPASGAVPDHTNDHITIATAGRYLVVGSITIANAAAQGHVVHIEVKINNGTTDLEPVHAHRTLTGGSTDIGSISINGIVELSVGDTVELWSITDALADRSVIFEDVILSIVKL